MFYYIVDKYQSHVELILSPTATVITTYDFALADLSEFQQNRKHGYAVASYAVMDLQDT